MNIAMIILSAAGLILFLLSPGAAIEGASGALVLWAERVFPALFPFMVVSTILIESSAVQKLTRFLAPLSHKLFSMPPSFIFVLLASFLAGYPCGAKLTADLAANGTISKEDASAMISATSTSGPMFMTGTVAAGMLGNVSFAPYLIVPHYAAAVAVALISCRSRIQPEQAFSHPVMRRALSPAARFSSALSGSVSAMLTVCGTMALFSAAANCIAAWLFVPPPVFATVTGIAELTTGCSAASALPLPSALPMISLLLGFGGMAVHLQTLAIASRADIKCRRFALNKTLHGALSCLFTVALLWLFPPAGTCCTPSILWLLALPPAIAVCLLAKVSAKSQRIELSSSSSRR